MSWAMIRLVQRKVSHVHCRTFIPALKLMIPPAFDSYPDAGVRAWSQVFAVFMLFFTT